MDPSSQGVACCDVVNRGEVYDNGKIFYNTLDNHTVAVDAKTGKEVWAVQLGEITKGQTLTMAPIVAHGKILVGNSGGEMGIHGWVTALDENTGKIAWRAYSIGADKDVLIGRASIHFIKARWVRIWARPLGPLDAGSKVVALSGVGSAMTPRQT